MTYHSDPKDWEGSSLHRAMRLQGGLLSGTTVLTASGVRPVETLAVGDRVIARSGLVRLTGLMSAPAWRTPLVLIRARSPLIPQSDRDLVIAAGQTLYLRGRAAFTHTGRTEAMIAAGRLADGLTILRTVLAETAGRRVYRLVFDAPEVIFAGGAEMGAASAGARRVVPA